MSEDLTVLFCKKAKDILQVFLTKGFTQSLGLPASEYMGVLPLLSASTGSPRTVAKGDLKLHRREEEKCSHSGIYSGA